jgi:hypothetical protein
MACSHVHTVVLQERLPRLCRTDCTEGLSERRQCHHHQGIVTICYLGSFPDSAHTAGRDSTAAAGQELLAAILPEAVVVRRCCCCTDCCSEDGKPGIAGQDRPSCQFGSLS